jgi:hypothetical protein
VDIVALFYDRTSLQLILNCRFNRQRLEDGKAHRHRQGRMWLSEVMTILVLFHSSNYRTFKHFYLQQVCRHLRREFPNRPSYNRFVEQIPRVLAALIGFLPTRFGSCSGIRFIDSTPLRVCHNMQIHSHRVMTGLAARVKTSVRWFYGFKLHLIINDRGEMLNVCFTPGNVSDHPTRLPQRWRWSGDHREQSRRVSGSASSHAENSTVPVGP